MRRVSASIARCLFAQCSALAIAASSLPSWVHGQPPSTIDIGSRRELFVDEFLIERFAGKAELRLHHPVPREAVMVFDQPWEGNTSSYPIVIREGDLYRMFYRGWQYRIEPGKFTQGHSAVMCYAESRDGIAWTRPELGLVGYPGPNGSKQNNILSISGRAGEFYVNLSTFTLFKDENPACAEDARFKGFVYAAPRDKTSTLPKRGLMPFKSPDGLRWTPIVEQQVITGDAFDSPNLAFWDSERGEYRAYWRYVTAGESGDSVPGSMRDIKTATSKDFVTWTAGVKLEYPGTPAEQLYTNQVKPYHRAPHIFVGLPTRYLDRGWSDSMRALPDAKHRELRSTGLPRGGTALTETVLMTSRDGLKFHRWPEAFIRPGIERPGSWAYGDHYAGWQLVETRSSLEGAPDELSLYTTEDYWTGKGSKLRRHSLRMDGFASVSAPMSGGEIVTKPLTFKGSKLTLNFSTSAAGGVQAEIQDADGKALPGFALDDCPPIFGDSIQRGVTWTKGGDLSAVAGKPVRLRFALKDADIFAFQFSGSTSSARSAQIGRDRQFFVDDHVVESKENVTRKLHQPVRDEHNPVLVGDQPWESWILEAHGRPVVFDPLTKQWMLYYVTWIPDRTFAYHQRYLTCVATSDDGIAWKKPKLGQFEWDGSRENNILNVGQQNWMRRANVILDEHETDPRRRFKMTFVDVVDGKTAIVRAASGDGLKWERLGEPWFNSGFGHNLNLLGWDARNSEYVLFPRSVVERRVGVGRATSKDFITWTDPKPTIIPEVDEPNLEFKGLGAFAYDDAYFGSLWVFFDGVEKAESELAFSRDGVNWTRPFRHEIFFPRGEAGQWDSAMILAPAPVVRDDQIWFYYTGWNFPYGPGPMTKVRKGWMENGERQQRAVGLAKLRLDGFASLAADKSEGIITTKPFEFVGDHLLVNAAAPQGNVSVAVLDRDGKTITTAARQNFDDVRWKPELSNVRGQVVRLRFHLRSAHLYAFQVQ